MRLVAAKKSRSLLWARWVLLAVAVSLLGYCGFVLADAWIFQKRESRHIERAASGGIPQTVSPSSPNDSPVAATKGLIGRLEIPHLGLSVVILEGIGKATLQRAVGHIPGTALPGQTGNVGLAGHRDTFFRPLQGIRRNDIITLTTLRGDYRYRVVSTRVVSPEEVSVLDSSGEEILTLVTCHPFYFVGAAPNRFIVRAERVADRQG
jgi:sortase A